MTGNSKSGGRRKTERYIQWRHEAGWMLKQQRPHKFKGEVEIEVRIRPPDKRVRDGDNLLKSIFDLLKIHRVIEDDNMWIVKKHTFEREDDKDQPECLVIVREAS